MKDAPGPVRCVLWDFGDTLVDQDWMLAPPDGLPEWTRAWVEVARGQHEHAWYLNGVSCEDIARGVGERLGLTVEETLEHMRSRCEKVRWFEAPWEVARRHALPQAIVTVNPDLFTRFLVPMFELESVFDAVVTSWQEGTADKGELCTRALARLGGELSPAEALLIDNTEECVRSWERRGGRAYHYRGEERFTADLRTVLRDLDAG